MVYANIRSWNVFACWSPFKAKPLPEKGRTKTLIATVAFIRLGTDYQDNYYQIEVPLKPTVNIENSSNRLARAGVFPDSNSLMFPWNCCRKLRHAYLSNPILERRVTSMRSWTPSMNLRPSAVCRARSAINYPSRNPSWLNQDHDDRWKTHLPKWAMLVGKCGSTNCVLQESTVKAVGQLLRLRSHWLCQLEC